MRGSLVLGFFALALAATAFDAESRAAPSKSARAAAKQHFDRAETHYRLGRFDAALKEYSKAYEIFPAPAFLFNIGQCHRNLDHHDRAIYFFRSFLAKTRDEETRKRVKQVIAEMEGKIVRERKVAQQQMALERERLAQLAPVRTTTIETVRTATTVVYLPSPPRDDSDELPTWPFVVGGVLAAVVAGVAIAVARSGGSDLPDGVDPALTIDLRNR